VTLSIPRALAALTLGLAPVLVPAAPAAAATCDVHVGKDGLSYTPSTLKVAPNTTVTWCFDGRHTVTEDGANPTFDSGEQTAGATYTHPFGTTGASYYCTVHGHSMAGQIVVVTPSKTPTHTPAPTHPPTTRPAATTPPPTRTPSPTTAPTTAAPTSAAPTTAAPTGTPTTAATTSAPAETASPTESETPLPTTEPAGKPKTGVAILAGLVLAVGALGGAGALWLRSRRP
jgi:plastocyanin